MALKNYKVTYNLPPGSYGILVEYKEAGTDVWIRPTAQPNPTMAQEYPLALETGKTFFIKITTQGPCAPAIHLETVTVPMDGKCCAEGYTLAPDGSYCYKVETIAPTIQMSDICLAPATLPGQYSSSGAFLFDDDTMTTYTELSTVYWKEPVSGATTGPMNREAVWVDSDCDGNKDAMSPDSTLQFSYNIESPVAKTVYIGVGVDNRCKVYLDGTTVISLMTMSGDNFNVWHLVPIQLKAGPNLFTFEAYGDGSTNDAFAAVIYDNTAAQLSAATQDTDLNILFKTSTYRGSRIDLATCAAGYTLDTSGGQGNYVCRRTLTQAYTIC